MKKDENCWFVGKIKKFTKIWSAGATEEKPAVAAKSYEAPVGELYRPDLYDNDDDTDDVFASSSVDPTIEDYVTSPEYCWMPCNVFHHHD